MAPMWFLLLACQAAPTVENGPFHFTAAGKVPSPTAIVSTPADPRALYVTEQTGRIWRLAGGQQVVVMDLTDRVASGGEKGLLGLAFAPTWPTDPRIFVNYTAEGGGLHTVVASFRVDGTSHKGDPASEVQVLTYAQPYSNHNSGPVLFGPDGMLYVTVGDGGSGGDPQGNGQNLGVLLGKILRIDVSGPAYTVPADNPFVGKEGARPEIWAYGVRNPWGAHFDGDTLWFADVGQNEWEEVNTGVKGANYGWNRMEGTHCFKATTCDQAGITLPVAEYGHDVGQSVTGGVVYRGPSIPILDGKYLYADFAAGILFAVKPGEPGRRISKIAMAPSTFGEDEQHRVYIADYGSGVLWRLDPP